MRDKIQSNALEIILSNTHNIMELGTGVGKSFIAIQAIEKIKGDWSIVLAETTHELNWINEFKKHNKEKLLDRVKFFCYQSLHKYLDNKNFVFDEAHHVLSSEKRLELLEKLNPNKTILLSATLTRTQKENFYNIFGGYGYYKYNLSQAIEDEILPEPKVYFIGINLDTTNKIHKFHWSKDKFSMCTEQEFYNNISSRIEYFKLKYFNSKNIIDKNKWLKCAMDRKRFLITCKTNTAKLLLNKLNNGNKRYICFTGSIEQSEELSQNRCINSKLKKEVVNKLINDFNEGISNSLYATAMMREGVNLNNIEIGVIIQLDNNLKYFSQVLGRSMRSTAPLQYVIYVKDTQDEIYVQTSLEDFNMDYVNFITINEIVI